MASTDRSSTASSAAHSAHSYPASGSGAAAIARYAIVAQFTLLARKPRPLTGGRQTLPVEGFDWAG